MTRKKDDDEISESEGDIVHKTSLKCSTSDVLNSST